jgi:hypothetical protein
MKVAGVKLKGWLTSGDDQVRDDHAAAGRQYGMGIPMDNAFIVGGESLMFPGDPSGSAAQIANCRCLQIALALASGKTLTLEDYDRMKFYSDQDLMKDTKHAA